MAIRVKYSIMTIMNAPLLGAIFGGHQNKFLERPAATNPARGNLPAGFQIKEIPLTD